MRSSFGVKVTAALCIGLGMIIVLGLLGYRSMHEFYQSDREVQRLLAVRTLLEAIRLDVEHAEMVQLRFQLTGNPADRDEFQAMTNRVRATIDEASKMLVAPDQKDRLKALERTASDRFQVLAEAIRLRGPDGAAMAMLFGRRGVETGRGIATIVDEIGEHERQMAKAEQERVATNAELMSRITFGGASLAILLLVWVIFVIIRYERDRRRAEGELRGAQERLALALEGSHSAVWDWNLVRNEIYLSAGWSQMLGAPAHETTVTPADLLQLVHPQERDRLQQVVQDALKGVTADYREEHRVRRVVGDWIWILSRGKVVRRDQQGRAVRIAGTNQDISDRKRAELALKEHDERLGLALETAGMASWNWDVASDEISWEDNPGRLLGPMPGGGYSSLRDVVHPEDLVHFIRELDALARTGAAYRDEFRITRTDGRVCWVLARGRAERDSNGKPTRVIGVAQDISESKEAEHALRASEGQMRLITNSVPAVIVYQDTGERIRFCNQMMAKMVGLRPEDAIGRPLREVLGEEVYRKIGPYVRRALAGEEVHFERTQITPTGQMELSVNYVPRRDERGEVEGFYSLATDITELKRLDRMKSEFVSTVSHELRTPLTSIRGSLGVLAGGVAGPLPDKARGFIDIAMNNCERLIRLINDILDMEKIESGKMTFQLRVLDLMELVAQVVKANEGFAAQHKVRLRIVAERPGAKVHADGDRLAQVLTNFISNACKFSTADSSVDIAVSAEGKRIRVGVADHGPGISEEFRKRIFQKFSQADSSDVRQKGGTGLGLSISKAIVEGLGGEIGFETEPAKGATFYFLLPEWHEAVATPAEVAKRNG
ncbi:MAG: PAS domain-containing protein [Betaproteobacteria bacterium]|nr:PAS domain-containing protein [Betaproteobacteria bacterium]